MNIGPRQRRYEPGVYRVTLLCPARTKRGYLHTLIGSLLRTGVIHAWHIEYPAVAGRRKSPGG